MKFCHEILKTLCYHMVKTQSLHLIGLGTVPGRGRQQDGWTDRIAVANTRYSYASSRA